MNEFWSALIVTATPGLLLLTLALVAYPPRFWWRRRLSEDEIRKQIQLITRPSFLPRIFISLDDKPK